MKRTMVVAAGLALVLSLVVKASGTSEPAEVRTSTTERVSTRIAYFSRGFAEVLGEVELSYGTPRWKQDYEKDFEAATRGKTWRFGQNFWTVLDTNLPLEIETEEVPPGSHYLGIRRSEDGEDWSLVFIDPVEARKNHLDAFFIEQATVAMEVPLTYRRVERVAEKLEVELKVEPESRATLVVRFGPVELSTPLHVRLDEPAS